MDSFVVRQEKTKSMKRRVWERDIWEIEGKFSSTYRHRIVRRLLKSYSELNLSPEHVSDLSIPPDRGSRCGRDWISSLEFDSKGIYLASVTNTGCLKVHDYESLYCRYASTQLKDARKKTDFRDETQPIVEICTREKLDAVRWNPTNQEEIGCVSERNGKVLLFDIGYESSKPSQVLERKLNPSIRADMEHFGLTDLAFSHGDKFKLIASGLDGNVHMWDRRAGKFSFSVTSDLFESRPLSSLQWTSDEQIVYAGCTNGNVYAWDLREGRTSTAFISHNEVYRPPLETITIASLLENISSLKAQTEIISSGVQSVNLNPSCWYQLAFHLNNGWSGVLDLYSKKVTHIHCPPPPWMTPDSPTATFYQRKPAWLPSVSIYVAASALDYGINILDFSPGYKSSYYVDNDSDGMQTDLEDNEGHLHGKMVQVSAPVVACTAHPLNTSFVGGTQGSSLALISQKYESTSGEESPSDGSLSWAHV